MAGSGISKSFGGEREPIVIIILISIFLINTHRLGQRGYVIPIPVEKKKIAHT